MIALDAAGLITALAYAALAIFSHRQSQVSLQALLPLMFVAWLALVAAAWRYQDAPRQFPWKRMIFWAVLFRVIGFCGQPILEDDYFRYLWDGRAFATTGNPYADRPIDHFSDSSVSPAFQRILDNVNNPHLPTIYGPVAEAAFAMAYWMAPGRLWSLKLILLLADLSTLLLLLSLTRRQNVLWYAWCPLLIQETAFSAHPESLGVLFVVAAIVFSQRSRWAPAAVAAALAVSVKPLAGIPLLLVLMKGTKPGKSLALAAGCLLAFYAPFLYSTGVGPLTSLGAFAKEWEYNSTIYAVLRAMSDGQTARWLCVAVFLIFYGAYAISFLRGKTAIPRGEILYGIFFLLSPVVNPWYLLWLLPFVALQPSAAGIAATAAVTLSYAHGLSIDALKWGAYGHPPWVRPAELALIVGAVFCRPILYAHQKQRRDLICMQ